MRISEIAIYNISSSCASSVRKESHNTTGGEKGKTKIMIARGGRNP